MIDLSKIGAFRFDSLPVDLRHVRDLEEFDGPLLSEYRSKDEETFLYYWCDCSDGVHRWIVIRTPPQFLFRYLAGQTSLRSLITDCFDRFVYFLDIKENKESEAWYMQADRLPANYLPDADSFHQRDQTIDDRFQDIYVGSKWDTAEASGYLRLYQNAYAFFAAFGLGGEPGFLLNYNLTQGWVFSKMFDLMKKSAPIHKRARLEAFALASPGYLRFKVDSAIAAGVRDSVAKYIANAAAIQVDVSLLRKWANNQEKDDEKSTDAEATAMILALCEQIGIDGSSLLHHSDKPQKAAKAAISYVNRIASLAQNDRSQTAILIGLPSSQPSSEE